MMSSRRGLLGVLVCLLLSGPLAGMDGDDGERRREGPPAPTLQRAGLPPELDRAAARRGVDATVGYLVKAQKRDGSWGSGALEGGVEYGFSVETYYAWQVAAHGLGCLALLECPETPARRRALERALRWLCSTRLPRRGSDWDTDYLWPALYGTVALSRAAEDPRVVEDAELARAVERRGRAFLGILVRNQTPDGGWAYYDDPPYTKRPKWATSFCTSAVLPSLRRCQRLGWGPAEPVITRAVRYLERCQLPEGAYEYDLNPVPRISGGEHINRVKGSLGRTQACNWALHQLGSPRVDLERIRRGLAAFVEQHKFLDVARMRPIPHEAYYANAGYFYFFGHYYASQVVGELPFAEREAWHRKLRPHIIKTLREDGSTSDFLGSTYMITASTAYAALTLQAGLAGEAAVAL